MKSEEKYDMTNTISKKHAATVLEVLLPKIDRLVKKQQLKCVPVKCSRYGRIPTREVISLLLKEHTENKKRNDYIESEIQELVEKMESYIDIPVDYQDGQKVLDKWSFLIKN